MTATTRSQKADRRSTLRSNPKWKAFEIDVNAIYPRRRIRTDQHLSKKIKNRKSTSPRVNSCSISTETTPEVNETTLPVPNLINICLPSEILEMIILKLEERTILIECQRVCKGWNEAIAKSPQIQQRLSFQSPADLSTLRRNPFADRVESCLHLDLKRVSGSKCHHEWFTDERMRISTYPRASWRRMVLG